MDNSIEIRPSKQSDIQTLSALAEEIWRQHYASIISEAQIAYMLSRGYSEESLLLQMGPKSQFFFVSERGGQMVAYTSFTVKTDGKRTWLYLNKLYSSEAVRGKGIGKALLSRVVEQAQRQGILTIRLNVNRYNPTVAWYLSRGFVVAEEMVLEIGMGYVMDDYVMELAIANYRP